MVRAIRVASIFLIATSVAACGPAPVTPLSYQNIAGTNLGSSTGGSGGSTGGDPGVPVGSGGSGGSGTGSSGNPSTGVQPPITMRVGTVGYNATTVQVQTGQVLKIKFTPGLQDQAISGTGVYPQYAHLGVYITVNGVTADTGMLSNGLTGGAPQTSSVLDFSNAVAGGCTGTGCRQTVTITIDHPNNDYWCYNFGEYCPWTQVYQTHPWNGTLTIQTDDTTAI